LKEVPPKHLLGLVKITAKNEEQQNKAEVLYSVLPAALAAFLNALFLMR
jgi:hypothetical protein